MYKDHAKAFEIWLKTNKGFYNLFLHEAIKLAKTEEKISAKYIVEIIRNQKRRPIPNALTSYLWRHIEDRVPSLKGKFTRNGK